MPLVNLATRMASAYLRDDRVAVGRLLPEAEGHFEEAGMGAGMIAMFHFYLGEPDTGFEWLERAYARREDSLMAITYDQDFDGVRSDPRYLDLVKRLGLGHVKYQQ